MRRSSAALGLALALFSSALPSAAADKWGILVLAHGGGPAWNQTVRDVVEKAGLPPPVEVLFGMAVTAGERDAMARAVDRLKSRGADKVLAVPFLVSSHSEVYRQYQYLLGLGEKPGFSDDEIRAMGAMHMHHGPMASGHEASMGPLTPIPSTGPALRLAPALDDSPEVLDALRERARAVSRSPGNEAVVLVAHGPNGEEDNRLWLGNLENIARGLKTAENFSEVQTATLRDDAPPPVKDEATRRLRDQVETLSKEGKAVLVLPVLIAADGIEKGLLERLAGLDCRVAAPMGDHPALSAWISRQAREAASHPR